MELVSRGCAVHYFLPPDEAIREAARQSGAVVESYLEGDPQDFDLRQCGAEDIPRDAPIGDRPVYERHVWPLASALLSGEYIIERCRRLRVQAVVYDPMTPHGLIVAEVLKIPCLSLVTYPGMGSLSDLLKDDARVQFTIDVRRPYGERIKERFGVDVRAEMVTRRQYFAQNNLVTTSEALVAPLPPVGKKVWADELREHFKFEAIGCMVNDQAPHVAGAASESAVAIRGPLLPCDLPKAQLAAAKARGKKIIFAALGTMALNDRWNSDLGRSSGGNLPMGTTGKQYCQHVWRALLDACTGLTQEFHCVLCVGSQPDALEFLEDAPGQAVVLPDNVTMRSSVSQVEMLSTFADVFISHAGFNSLQESVFAGVPIIAIPQAVDQPANALKVQRCGWGRALLKPMEAVTAASIRTTLQDVTAPNAPYKFALDEARDSLRCGERRAADRLLGLMRDNARRGGA